MLLYLDLQDLGVIIFWTRFYTDIENENYKLSVNDIIHAVNFALCQIVVRAHISVVFLDNKECVSLGFLQMCFSFQRIEICREV